MRYESRTDLAKQTLVAQELLDHWGKKSCGQVKKFTVVKLPDDDRADFAVEDSRGTVVSLLEIKARAVESVRYSDILVPYGKLFIGSLYARWAGIPFIIASAYTDGVVLYADATKLTNEDFELCTGQRTDRNDPADKRLHAKIVSGIRRLTLNGSWLRV